MRYVVMFDFTLSGGEVKRVSIVPAQRKISGQWAHYDPYVVACTPIRIEMPIPPGRLPSQQITVSLLNPGGEVTDWDEDFSLQAATLDIRICEPSQAYSTHGFGIYHGTVLDMISYASDRQVDLIIDGNMALELGEIVAARINSTAFPNLPTRFLDQFFENWPFGVLAHTGGPGAILCPLVDTVNNDHLIGTGLVEELTNVYDGDTLLTVTTDYTLQKVTGGDSVDRHHIRLTSPADGLISADVQGFTDDGLETGTAVTEATAILKRLWDLIGIDTSVMMDETSRTVVAALAMTGATTINDDTTGNEFMKWWCDSFQIGLALGLFVNSDRKLIFKDIAQESLGPTLPAFRAIDQVIAGSLRNQKAPTIKNQVMFNYNHWPLTNQYESTPIFKDKTSQTRTGRVHKTDLNQRFIRDAVLASERVDKFQRVQREVVREFFWGLDLAEIFDSAGGPRLQPGDSLDAQQLSQLFPKATHSEIANQPIVLNALEFDVMEGILGLEAKLYGLVDSVTPGDPFYRDTEEVASTTPPALGASATTRELFDQSRLIAAFQASGLLNAAVLTHSGGADSDWYFGAGIPVQTVLMGFFQSLVGFVGSEVTLLADTPSPGEYAVRIPGGVLDDYRLSGDLKPNPAISAGLQKMIVLYLPIVS